MTHLFTDLIFLLEDMFDNVNLLYTWTWISFLNMLFFLLLIWYQCSSQLSVEFQSFFHSRCRIYRPFETNWIANSLQQCKKHAWRHVECKMQRKNPKTNSIFSVLVVSQTIVQKKRLFPWEILVYQKSDPQPSIHLIRLGEKTNEVAKKKLDLLLRDVKTVNFAPTMNDKRQQSSLAIELTTADREHTFVAVTFEEKQEFVINLRKVCCKKKLSHCHFISTV